MTADRFVESFGGVPEGENGTERLANLAARAVGNGFAVVLVTASGKAPICTLTSRETNESDRAARERAFQHGDRRWEKAQHACGWAHAFSDPVKASAAVTRLSRQGRLNLGIELKGSRMICVDADTAAQVAAFASDMESHGHAPMDPTVMTPGFLNEQGEWTHKDGGHYWFYLPDGEDVPSDPYNMKMGPEGAQYSIYWANQQILVPPSVRKEGPYRLTGASQAAPTWLLDAVRRRGEEQAANRETARERALARAAAGETDSGIDVWSATTTWADLLTPDGWTMRGEDDDTCGCPIWTRPGDWSNWKSATAHELGCVKFPCERGHGPLHIWTDSPPEYLIGQPRTLTKIMYEAAKHGGIAEACSDWGIVRDGQAGIWDPTTAPEAITAQEPSSDPFMAPGPSDESFDDAVAVEQARQDADDDVPRDGQETIDAERRAKIDEMFPDVDWHTSWDGAKGEVWIVYPMLSEGRLITIYSEPKMGKSLLMLELAAGIAAGVEVLGFTPDRPRKVLYVDFENTIDGDVVPRLKDMGWTPDGLQNLHYQSFPSLAALDSERGGEQLLQIALSKGCEVVIIDTVSRAVDGGENDNDTWLNFYRKTGLKLKSAGLTTARLDHTGKNTTAGPRGGSAKLGDVDATWHLTEVEADTRYRLWCDGSRMVIADKEVIIRRDTSPLRHVVEAGGLDPFDGPVRPPQGRPKGSPNMDLMRATVREFGPVGCIRATAVMKSGIPKSSAYDVWAALVNTREIIPAVEAEIDRHGSVMPTKDRYCCSEFDPEA
jgi:hypothetical protein